MSFSFNTTDHLLEELELDGAQLDSIHLGNIVTSNGLLGLALAKHLHTILLGLLLLSLILLHAAIYEREKHVW